MQTFARLKSHCTWKKKKKDAKLQFVYKVSSDVPFILKQPTRTFAATWSCCHGDSDQCRSGEHMECLVPVGGAHERRRGSSERELLLSDGSWPRLLDQTDIPFLNACHGLMQGHAGRHHLRVRKLC